jgi:hypothetical protein
MPGRATPPMPDSARRVRDERVDQRAGARAGGRVDDKPGRLVDDDQLVVLVNDIERNRLGRRCGRGSGGGRSTTTVSPGLTGLFGSTIVRPPRRGSSG